MNVGEKLQQAVRLHQSGKVSAAAAIYQAILAHDPRVADAWHLIGLVAYEVGQFDDAAQHIARAIQLHDKEPTFYSNLASALLSAGRWGEAADVCQTCQQRFPGHAAGWLVHGNVLRAAEYYEQAVDYYRQALQHDPDAVEALINLGGALTMLGRLADAEPTLRRALELRPDAPQGLSNLGVLLRKQGRLDEAISWFDRALRTGVAIAEVHMNRANCFRQQGRLTQAVEGFEAALAINPQLAPVYNGVGMVMQDAGRPEEAAEFFARARELAPQDPNAQSNYLFCLNLCGQLSREEVFAAHREWGKQVPRPAVVPEWPQCADPDRPLRIGYVSPDLRQHAVARFLEPILQRHTTSADFEVFCYAEVAAPDDVTRRLAGLADHWSTTCGRRDEDVAARIRHDQIDILIDLAGHTANNRLPVFAHRPAPIQISMLGYPNTTGLAEIDYYITNAVRDPVGEDRYYTEQLVRVERGPFAFQPPRVAPDVGPAPVLRNGHVTLGSTHRLDKLTDSTLRLWQQVMQAIPSARLLVFRTSLGSDAELRGALLDRLSNAGIDTQRVQLRWECPDGYLSIYHDIDILLEAQPWASGTSAVEAMWLGVPVVGIYGDRPTSRPVCALLRRLELPHLIAKTPAEYADIIQRLATSPAALGQLRSSLRDRLAKSIADGKSFPAELEATYRRLWQTWCVQRPRPSWTSSQRGRAAIKSQS